MQAMTLACASSANPIVLCGWPATLTAPCASGMVRIATIAGCLRLSFFETAWSRWQVLALTVLAFGSWAAGTMLQETA